MPHLLSYKSCFSDVLLVEYFLKTSHWRFLKEEVVRVNNGFREITWKLCSQNFCQLDEAIEAMQFSSGKFQVCNF